jgi:hypothetical protein
MPTDSETLQQGAALSHRASRLMGLGPSVGVESRLIRLKGWPIDEPGMMIGDEHGPLPEGKMAQAFFDGALIIDVTFTSGLAVGVSASIHRIGQDVVDRGVGGTVNLF